MPYLSRVDLPADVGVLYAVFVNGVPQEAGKDYERLGGSLCFTRELKQEGPLGFWRWTSIFLGIAGTYRQDDWVDVVYDSDGERTVKTRVKIAPVKPKKVSPEAAASPSPTTES